MTRTRRPRGRRRPDQAGTGGAGPLRRRADHQDSPARRHVLPPAGAGDQRRAAPRQPGLAATAGPAADHPARHAVTRGPGPGRLLADKAYSSKAARSHLRQRHIQAGHPRVGRSDRATGAAAASAAGGRPASTPSCTSSATPWSGPSANCASTGPWQPATTNATSSTAEPWMSPPSASGSAIPCHDLRDTP